MKQFIAIFFLAIFVHAGVEGQVVPRAKQFNLMHGLAIEGYDPVSYFAGKPLKGKKELSNTYMGVTYRFATTENLESFKKNPSAFEPMYGGWCAYAMGSSGEKVEVDPETYKIIDGRLYLYYNSLFNNTLKTWNKAESSLKPKADANWMKINK
jgi:YHS domain-containing protein